MEFPITQKDTACQGCAARGAETNASHSARALVCAQAHTFYLTVGSGENYNYLRLLWTIRKLEKSQRDEVEV